MSSNLHRRQCAGTDSFERRLAGSVAMLIRRLCTHRCGSKQGLGASLKEKLETQSRIPSQ